MQLIKKIFAVYLSIGFSLSLCPLHCLKAGSPEEEIFLREAMECSLLVQEVTFFEGKDWLRLMKAQIFQPLRSPNIDEMFRKLYPKIIDFGNDIHHNEGFQETWDLYNPEHDPFLGFASWKKMNKIVEGMSIPDFMMKFLYKFATRSLNEDALFEYLTTTARKDLGDYYPQYKNQILQMFKLVMSYKNKVDPKSLSKQLECMEDINAQCASLAKFVLSLNNKTLKYKLYSSVHPDEAELVQTMNQLIEHHKEQYKVCQKLGIEIQSKLAVESSFGTAALTFGSRINDKGSKETTIVVEGNGGYNPVELCKAVENIANSQNQPRKINRRMPRKR